MRQHTYQPDEGLRSRTPTRADRQFAKKLYRRGLKKAHRKALHGLPRLESPPSLLQSLRLGLAIQQKQAEVDALLAAHAKAD